MESKTQYETLYEEKINRLFNHLTMKNHKMTFEQISNIETKIIIEEITTITELNKEIKRVYGEV